MKQQLRVFAVLAALALSVTACAAGAEQTQPASDSKQVSCVDYESRVYESDLVSPPGVNAYDWTRVYESDLEYPRGACIE